MLFKNSYYSYFFLVFVFLFLCFVSLFFSWDPLTKNFIYLFTVLLLPIFDYMIDVIKKEFDMTVFKVDSLTLLKYIFLLCVWSFLYSKWYTTPTLLTLLFLVFSLLFHIWSKIPFFIALLLFLYSAVHIIWWLPKVADTLSIYAYYFLIIWVLTQVYQFYLIKFFPSEQK